MQEEEKRRKIKKLQRDFKQFAKALLKIKTKRGTIEPLIFNDAQEYIHEQLEAQLSSKGYIRALILKARQQGASTYVGGRFYWRTSMNYGKQAFILTHEQAATDNLFNLTKRYHDNNHPAFQPETSAANAKELIFSNRNSGYKVGTAGSKAVGRSGTVQYVHNSEIAFWPFAEDHFAGLMQCVPSGKDAEGTEVIIESTANGVGGKFHELWVSAIMGESEYLPIFIPWFWTSEYRADATDIVLTDDEIKLKAKHEIEDEQIAWRRIKIGELGSDLFKQEYPFTWQEAFLSTGRTVFDKDAMENALGNTWKPECRMILERSNISTPYFIRRNDKTSYYSFVERDDGELRVWFKPEPRKRYVIAGDVAEGLTSDGDYSCLDVLEYPSGQQVAQWHGHIAPDLLGEIAYVLGMYYNKAHIGVEANNHGILTNAVLRDAYYPMLHAQTIIDDKGSDSKETKRVGWLTTSKSKPYIIDQLSAELREGTAWIACKETVLEMQSFVVREDGKLGAQDNCYDDRVMARAIAGEMLRAYGGRD